MTDGERAVAVFVLVLFYGLVMLLAGCRVEAPESVEASPSSWHWDCPLNELGHEPACVEVAACGETIDHDPAVCCHGSRGSGSDRGMASPRARAACEPGKRSWP